MVLHSILTGSLYIADTFNNCVREVVTGGTISTVAGNGTPTLITLVGTRLPRLGLTFHTPWPMIPINLKLYIDDYGNNRIRMVSGGSTGLTAVAGTGAQGYFGDGARQPCARLNYPYGIAVDSAGNLYIADTGNNVVRKVTYPTYPSGIINTIAGELGLRLLRGRRPCHLSLASRAVGCRC